MKVFLFERLKTVTALFVVGLLFILFCGCQSASVKIEEEISKIGTPTIADTEVINDIDAEIDKLSKSEKSQIQNLNSFYAAQKAVQARQAEIKRINTALANADVSKYYEVKNLRKSINALSAEEQKAVKGLTEFAKVEKEAEKIKKAGIKVTAAPKPVGGTFSNNMKWEIGHFEDRRVRVPATYERKWVPARYETKFILSKTERTYSPGGWQHVRDYIRSDGTCVSGYDRYMPGHWYEKHIPARYERVLVEQAHIEKIRIPESWETKRVYVPGKWVRR